MSTSLRLSLLHGFASEAPFVCNECKSYLHWTYWASMHIIHIINHCTREGCIIHIINHITHIINHWTYYKSILWTRSPIRNSTACTPSKLRHHLQGSRSVKPQVQVMQRKPRNPPCSLMDHGFSAMSLSSCEGRAKPPKRKFIQACDIYGALCILCSFYHVGARKRKGELKYIRLYLGDSTSNPWSAARLIMWNIQDRLTNSCVQYKKYKYTSKFIFCCGPCMHGSCLRAHVVKRKGKRKFLVSFHGDPLLQKVLRLLIFL